MSTPVGAICCRVVDPGAGVLPGQTYWLGQVEFGKGAEVDASCARALRTSMDAFGVASESAAGLRLVRARVLLLTDDLNEAQTDGDTHIRETVSIFNTHLTMMGEKLRCTDAGYLLGPSSREVRPLLPPRRADGVGPTVFMLDEIAHHPVHVVNTLLTAPAAFGELAAAFRRSTHWQQLAESAGDPGEKLLLHWMACECLCKIGVGDAMAPKLMAASGFPTGKLARALAQVAGALPVRAPVYRRWRVRLNRLFEHLRQARNSIVHSGFRHTDLPDLLAPEEIVLAQRLMPTLSRVLGAMALHALDGTAMTVGEMWGRYPLDIANGLSRHADRMMSRLDDFVREGSRR